MSIKALHVLSETEVRLTNDELEIIVVREVGMTDAEWEAFQHSRIADFFTPPNVVVRTWRKLRGK